MSQQSTTRRSGMLYLLVAFVVALGGLAIWKAAGPPGSSRRASAPVDEAVRERERVAAVDPSFDPAQPLGVLEGEVKDADGRPVDGAVVAIVRQRGRDELATFTRPLPRTASTTRGGRFQLTEVLPGEYGVTASAALGSPALQGKVKVESGQTTRLTLTLGKGGVLFSGEANDVGGGPIAGARALLRSTGFSSAPGQEAQWFQVAADDKGIFQLRLLAGEYELTVQAGGYAPVRDRLYLSADQSRRYKLHPAARLSGRVLDRQSREPVPGASVWLRTDRLETFVERDATADDQGRFSFDDLGAGGYVVVARARDRIGLGQTVSVGIAQGAEVDVLVERGRVIKGVVTSADGKGMAGARVFAGRFDPPFERPVLVKSGKDGAFVLEGLLPAKYRVNGWAEGKGSSKPETAQVTSRDVEGLRLALGGPVAVVRGQVLDGSGQPVAEASVVAAIEMAGPERRFTFDRASTDAAGKFELIRMQPGRVTLTARHPDKGNAKWGPEDLAAVPGGLVLRMSAASSVEGLVRYEEGSPAKGVVVMVQPAQWSGPMFGPPDQSSTDDSGRFRVGGLGEGRFMVMARRDNFGPSPRGRTDVTLALGEHRKGIELIVLNAGKRVAGKVVGPDGQPVSGAVVTGGVEREGHAFRMPMREGMPGGLQAVSDGDGNFALEDLQEGVYTLWASDSVHADGETKGVVAGASGVMVRLQGGGSVAGVVLTKQGQPVGDYTISAVTAGPAGASPEDRMRNQMNARMWSPSAQVHDPAGAFLIGRLGPGNYQLTVTTADGQGGMLPVTLAAAENKQGLRIQIDAGARLVGRVVELEGGKPLEGVNVMVTGSITRLQGVTGKDGAFSVEGLAPGRARVDLRLGGGDTHVPEYTDIEVKPGAGDLDVGLVKLMKGNPQERVGGFNERGRAGFGAGVMNGKATVTVVNPGLPADRAGVKQGDVLLAVDGRPVDGLGNGALGYLAGGKQGEKLTIKIQPGTGGAPRDVVLERVPMNYVPPGGARPPGSPAAATASTGSSR